MLSYYIKYIRNILTKGDDFMIGGLHKHEFNDRTSVNDRHRHNYRGITSVSPDYPRHTHYMSGETSFEDGHTHKYYIETGPAIKRRGGHIHYYYGYTTRDDGHVHYMRGYTSVDDIY
jgi:hypothetical protein